MVHYYPWAALMVPFFVLPHPESKPDQAEKPASRKKLLSASERLRVPTPSERLLQD